jgi:hypothetical protein
LENNSRIGEKPRTILKKKSLLSQTNPYLSDKAKRLSGLVVSVCSSSAIEGIEAKTFIKDYLKKKR